MKNKNFKLIISLFMLFVPIFLLVTSQYGCTKNEDKNVTEKNVEGEVNDTETSKDEDNKDAKDDDKKSVSTDKDDEKDDNLNAGKSLEISGLKVYTMKGPTAMSMAPMVNFLGTNLVITGSIEEQIAALKKDEGDIYLIPSNLFAKLKNSGMNLEVLYGNAGNVLNLVGKNEIKDISELKGKTIALTGRGAVPEMILNKLLETANLTQADINPVFLNEPTEAAPIIKKNADALLLLPEPFATAIAGKVEGLKPVIDINKVWKDADLPQVITSVIVAKANVYKEKSQDIIKFLNFYTKGIDSLRQAPATYSKVIESMGIVPQKVAENSLPKIEFVNLTGKALHDELDKFFSALMDTNPELIGGKLPQYEN